MYVDISFHDTERPQKPTAESFLIQTILFVCSFLRLLLLLLLLYLCLLIILVHPLSVIHMLQLQQFLRFATFLLQCTPPQMSLHIIPLNFLARFP